MTRTNETTLDGKIEALPSDQPAYEGHILVSTNYPEPIEVPPKQLEAAKEVAANDGTIVLRHVLCVAKASQEYDAALSADFTIRYCKFTTVVG